MAQFLHPQRLDQAHETAQAISLLENVVETGIAGICRARGLFPANFFQSFRTVDGMVSRFDLDALLNLHSCPAPSAPAVHGSCEGQAHANLSNPWSEQHGTHPPQWNVHEWNRFRAEAIILLEWIRYGALQVLRDGRLARLTFGIHLHNIVESYSVSAKTFFDFTHCVLFTWTHWNHSFS